MIDNKLSGVRIKELRTKMNMTQNDFCELINCTQATLSGYENGTKNPSLDNLLIISEKCNVTMDWLCGLSDIQKTKNFESYSDIFNLIVNICKSIDIAIDKRQYSENEYDITLVANNLVLCEFLEKWTKIKSIYDDDTIDEDTYEIVIKSLVNKYQDHTLYYKGYKPTDNSIIEYTIPDDIEF